MTILEKEKHPLISNSLDKYFANEEASIEFFESMKSRPVDKINIPEIRNAKVNFVYNYFTRDERLRPDSNNSGEKIVNLNFSNSDEIFYRVRNERIARYNEISFKPPKLPSLESKGTEGQDEKESEYTTRILNNLLYEGGFSNQVFTGIEIIDLGGESKLYTMLNGSIFFLDVQKEGNSNREAVKKLHNILEEKGGLKGQDKKILFETFKNITSNGYNLAKTDVSDEIANTAADPLGKQTFSIQFNNLLMRDLIKNSIALPDNVFQDELRALEIPSENFRNNTLSRIDAVNTYRETDYDLEIPGVELSEMPASTNLLQASSQTVSNTGGEILGNINSINAYEVSQYPEIKFVGYVVEKYEVNPDETVTLLNRKFINNYASTYSIDESVRYGGVYFYKIRTVCRVKTPITIEDQIMLATAYMASEGIIANVRCIETVPPPPPQNMKAKFDFETLLPKIYWQLPPNKQRDIKRFQIFKRLSTGEPFRLLKEYNFDDSLVTSVSPEVVPDEDIIYLKRPRCIFVDTTHKEGETPIYAVACVDAHGMTSNYGPQIRVKRDYITNRVTSTIISREGAPKPYPNIFLAQDTFQDAIKTSNYDRVKIVFDPEYYDVVKTRMAKKGQQYEDSLNLLAIDENNFRYRFHFINIDNQKDKTVNVKLIDKSSPGTGDEDVFNTNIANFSNQSLNFQYNIE